MVTEGRRGRNNREEEREGSLGEGNGGGEKRRKGIRKRTGGGPGRN